VNLVNAVADARMPVDTTYQIFHRSSRRCRL
jgi:hypothetical protein